MIEAIGVGKRFGDITALNDIHLRVEEGAFYGLLGPNGAGKSTFMGVVSGYLKPDLGEIRVGGELMKPAHLDQRKKLGLVPQSIALYEDLNPLDNLKIAGRIYDMSGPEIRARSQELLKQLSLWDRRKDRVKNFSGGMKRRLNIAVSLLHSPQVLLCDEPTVGVDPQSRAAIFEFLRMINNQGVTVIYTTHYMEEAERLCERIAIIDHGKIIAEGTLSELLGILGTRQTLAVEVPSGFTFKAESAPSSEWRQVQESWSGVLKEGSKLSSAVAELEAMGIESARIRLSRPTLEDLFLHLTGNTLRE